MNAKTLDTLIAAAVLALLAAIAITSTSAADSEPCSQTSSTTSKPAEPDTTTSRRHGNTPEQTRAHSPAQSAADLRVGFLARSARPAHAAHHDERHRTAYKP